MRRAVRALPAVLVATAALGFAASATAAGTTAAGTGTSNAAPSGSISVWAHKAFQVSHQQVTIPGRKVLIQGSVSPYVPGQRVTVQVYFNKRLVKTFSVRIKPDAGGKGGHFQHPVRSPGVGHVKVVVEHAATAQLGAFKASHSFDALNPNAGFGSSGEFVRLIQQQLASLHFYVLQNGVYDSSTGLAIDAYHRLMHWGVSQNLDSGVVNALLNGEGSFTLRFPHEGRHAEGSLSDQLLALADGSHVYWIFPISSGKPSTPTILGNFHVYSRVPGYLPDGMYYSDFFYGGYAIHGYNPAPDYPASHGCMRLPIQDAIPVFNWLAMGDAVNTYY